MKHAALIGTFTALILLTGCNNDPEETPDITEAIPVEGEAGSDGDSSETGSDSDVSGLDNAGNEGGERATPTSPSAPSTMESGSNSPGAEIELDGSKLQRADPQ